MIAHARVLLACVTLSMYTISVCQASLPGDAEAATHGDEAATLQVVKETEVSETDFVFRQYNLAVLSHYSYLIGSKGEALVIDPARDISRYLKDADSLQLKITRIYLTHSHADFVAGHIELAKATRATVLVNRATEAGYEHQSMEDGEEFRMGNLRARVMTTPGHTPDGACLLIFSPADNADPRMVLTGDTLFIGSVGRPDLMGGGVSAASLAKMGFESWTQKLSKLSDGVLIFPAHGAGSLCGAHLSDKPVSTFGEQKSENPYLQHKDLNSFVMAVIDGLPEAPQYFKFNAKMNHDGPPLVDWAKGMPPALTPQQTRSQGESGTWIIDTRDAKEYSAGHVPGSINIGLRGRFETWTGIMIPWGEPFVLVGSDDFVKEAAFRLHRIGYDAPAGYLSGGMEAWTKEGLPVQTVTLIKPTDLYQKVGDGTAPVIVDVRLPSEWMALRITQNLLNIPVNKLFQESSRLAPDMDVLTVCNSAYRSSMGASVLQKVGFKKVWNMEGGSEAWIAAGLPTYGSTTAGSALPPGVYVNLPEQMGPQDLARRMMDLPGTVDVLDIRPAWQFAEYSIPGSVNIPVQQVMSSSAYLNDRRPLIIVCRDGSISSSVAGALVQKTPRPIRFLSGGVTRYYEE
ncbi:MAG TPA: rhodanese-like domain-containing protein, partial [Acidobacteriota bacterium]|nr:rhodanese-like domain-containing protein [Acidobacteriota bacterium]